MSSILRGLSNVKLTSKEEFSDAMTTVVSEDFSRFVLNKQTEDCCIEIINDFFRNFGVRLPEETVFRYACFHNFDAEVAIDAIREDNNNPCLKLKMGDLENQFESDSVFPLPHLLSRKNAKVVYMRPSRFNGTRRGFDKVLDSICYVLNDLSQNEEQCRNGVTVLADMQDVTKENFPKDHCIKLLEVLQGAMVPTRVVTFLIVSPPSWFGRMWKWMRPAMSKDFSRRVHLIKEDRLSEFLMDDYEMYLPDDLTSGLARASEISEDYVDLKMMQEL